MMMLFILTYTFLKLAISLLLLFWMTFVLLCIVLFSVLYVCTLQIFIVLVSLPSCQQFDSYSPLHLYTPSALWVNLLLILCSPPFFLLYEPHFTYPYTTPSYRKLCIWILCCWNPEQLNWLINLLISGYCTLQFIMKIVLIIFSI